MAASVISLVSELVAKGRSGFFLTPKRFADLAGFERDDHLEAFRVFALSCAAIAAKSPPLRNAASASASVEAIAHAALRNSPRDDTEARQFFETHFNPLAHIQ